MTTHAELRALLAAATPGPWIVSADEPYEGYVQRRQIEAGALGSKDSTCQVEAVAVIDEHGNAFHDLSSVAKGNPASPQRTAEGGE